ncbi:tRNA (pseudouridine(54)-N(1))-methyltransferase TrmY [Methanoplanus sp. FWC-SCC4]|uniref:tRNA (pseudouridine(54)-N(1))-methyltransferase n=1 Tax=Methanochimaera problematica TaxID=2609417 RepID=A0AA97FE28_9EURY|nr:tRNA (pseudouridine(54)-N(1))-methyltransferase TrmY [Methanoplanus sp. FWC-SCC4]WOF15756.1 tRNA (pseudouridine(54)-N(1))-methyltransferase TrmY [Methanoplanus sp. FWC-SCC4]
MTKRFLVVGHKACTTGDFSLNDMPGGAGRMDVLCRCVNSCFFLSHDLRHDVECFLVLLGEPEPPKTILIKGNEVRYLSPDERSAGSLIKKALNLPCGESFRESTKGIYVRKGNLKRLLEEYDFALLDENGKDIRAIDPVPESFILSDHHNFTEEEEEMIKNLPKVSAGPKILHADHTITVILNEMDRRET